MRALTNYRYKKYIKFRICQRSGNTGLLTKKVIIFDYHNIKLRYLGFSWDRFTKLRHVTEQRYFQILRKSIQKERFKDQLKTCEDPKKMNEESSTGSLTDMADDIFAESLKSPECVEILFNCLKNVERQTKDIYTQHNTVKLNAKSS